MPHEMPSTTSGTKVFPWQVAGYPELYALSYRIGNSRHTWDCAGWSRGENTVKFYRIVACQDESGKNAVRVAVRYCQPYEKVTIA